MTFAPQSIAEARQFLLATFDMHPGHLAADLDPDEVGIVGDSAHRGGYHCGRDRCSTSDYSVAESQRDRAGLSLASSALDVGEFDEVVAGQRVTLRTLSLWLVEQCRAGTPDTADIREVIYSPDGKTVKRWDRLGRRSSGDSSHLVHTHISYFRDSEGRSKRPLFVRFAAQLRGLEEVETDMPFVAKDGDTGQYYVCDLITSRPVDADDVPHVIGLARQLGYGHGPEGVEWADGGWTRLGWSEGRFGTLAKPAPAVKVDAGELARAILADPGFAATLADAAFQGAQRAERE